MTATRTTLRRASRFTITPEAMIYDRTLPDRAVRIWMILDRMCQGREVTFPSRQMLADALPLNPDGSTVSLSSVDRAVRLLCEKGWLMKERADRGDVNAYVLLEGPPEAPVVTHDDTPSRHQRRHLSSPVTAPVVTHDAQGETGDQEKNPPAPSEQAPPLEAEPAPTPKRRGTRLPSDWSPSDDLRKWTFDQGVLIQEITSIIEVFVDYWIAQPGQKGSRVDWDATWRNWIRKDLQRKAEQARREAGRQTPQERDRAILEASLQRGLEQRQQNPSQTAIEGPRRTPWST